MKGKTLENIMMAAIIITAAIIFFNQMLITDISSSLISVGLITGSISSKATLSGTDVSDVTSTAMAVVYVFPELQNAKNEQDVMEIMLPTGTPEYSSALGGITFDDPITSLNYLSKWYDVINEDIKNNDPEVWQRYLNLAAAPRGISCEFCCGVGSQGITANGDPKCGCQHSPAFLAITLGLMKYTDYSDAEILREIMKWKTLFFPKNMITIGIQVIGQDLSQLKELPGMVGGC